MKQLLIILCLLCYSGIHAQQRFVKAITHAGYGTSLRIVPTPDNGWVIFSMDSLKLTKFSPCGAIEWSKDYAIPNCFYHADFISTPGGFALLSRQATDGATTGALITTMDALGNITASKNIILSLCTLVPYNLFYDQGTFIIYANASQGVNTTYNMLCKVDLAGTVLWTQFYDLGVIWGKGLATSDQGFLLRTGNRFIKTDATGNVQWTSRVDVFSMSYYAAVEVSDGYIFTTIDIGTQIITFYKLDKQGKLLWGKIANYTGDLPYLRKLAGDRFAAVFNENSTGNNYPVVIEFDKDVNALSQNAYSSNQPGTDLFGKDLTFLNDGNPAITGFAGTVPYPFCIKTDKAYQSSCDVPSPPISFTPGAATYALIAISKSPRNFTMVNQATNTLPLNPSLATWCQSPKSLDLGVDTTLCQGQTLLLKNRNGELFDTYLWSTGETTPTIRITKPGLYWLRTKDNCDANTLTDSCRIEIIPSVIANLGNDILTCEDIPVMLQVSDCSSCIYTWSTGHHTRSAEITGAGTYWVKIDNDNGCSSADTIQVDQLKCKCSFFVPNSFTPNGDGLNDLFMPKYDCDMERYSMRIFDRWGELIYETGDREVGWDGKYKGQAVKKDIYTYVINYDPVIKGDLQRSVSKSGFVAVISN